MHDLHHLDLVELVLADHAARVLAVASRLGAEARRVRGQADGQRLRGQDRVAHRVGQRDLGGRDQVEPLVAFGAALDRREHLLLELRQLRGPDQRLGVHDVGRVALGVAVLARVGVEHELRQRAMQRCERAAQEREACAGELRGGREVEQAERLAEVDVVACGTKLNSRGVPHRRTSTLSSAERPTGVVAWVRLGRLSRKSRSRPCTASSSASAAFNSSPRPATSASRGVASSPFPFAMPTCFERALRRCCNSWVRTWMDLRWASRASKPSASSVIPRSANRTATAAKSLRKALISSI